MQRNHIIVAAVLAAATPAAGQPPAHHPGPFPTQYTQKVVAQEVAVAPLIVHFPVESKGIPPHAYGSPYYYSVGQAYQEKAYLREVIREELRALAGGTSQPTSGGYAPHAAAAPVQAPATEQRASAAVVPDDVTPPEIQKAVLAAYQGRAGCVSCHGAGPNLSGNFRLVLDDGRGNYALAKQPSAKRWQVWGMAASGVMPPAAAKDGSKAMEPEALAALLQYARIKDR